MKKIKVNGRVSIINRLILLMFLLGLIALVALSLSIRIANDTKGSANLINQLGLLRMKSYQLLTMVPLAPNQHFNLNIFTEEPLSLEHSELLNRYKLANDFKQLQARWLNDFIPKIRQAHSIEQIRVDINSYVNDIDHLVYAIDLKTENQISDISRLQLFFIILIVIFLILQIYYLRQHLFIPWMKLVRMATAISQHNFTERFPLRHDKNEFDILGQAFNHMSEQVELQYSELEQRVSDKTAALQNTNDIVSFLYQATKLLHTAKPVCERFLIILHELEDLTPLSQFQMRFYETDDLERYQEISLDKLQKLPDCQNMACSACLIPSKPHKQGTTSLYWYLQDNNEKYGLLFAILPDNETLTLEQEQLIAGLVEQMTVAIALDRQIERQKQYLLMKERAAMARELHDSIAQSLSCLKIHVSCLQMQSDSFSPESITLLNTMRKEINVAYSQLRELITSFRLQLNQTGFYASLVELIKEFEIKLGFSITFNYQLPFNIINSKYAIHLLQIVREALNNIYKHAQATNVIIDFMISEQKNIIISVADNGIGIKNNDNKDNHYGLIIMQDRVDLLNGDLTIESKPNNGTKIIIEFENNRDIPFISKE